MDEEVFSLIQPPRHSNTHCYFRAIGNADLQRSSIIPLILFHRAPHRKLKESLECPFSLPRLPTRNALWTRFSRKPKSRRLKKCLRRLQLKLPQWFIVIVRPVLAAVVGHRTESYGPLFVYRYCITSQFFSFNLLGFLDDPPPYSEFENYQASSGFCATTPIMHLTRNDAQEHAYPKTPCVEWRRDGLI